MRKSGVKAFNWLKIEVKKSLIRGLNIVFDSNSSTVKLYTLTDQINYTELARWIPDQVGNDSDKKTFSQHNLTIMPAMGDG